MSIFSKVSRQRLSKNKFDLSHERKMSLQMANLTPIMVQSILPGDSFKVNSEIFMRLAPMLAPVMHRINVTTHYFFVPNRIVWDEWEDFITGGRDGTLEPSAPYYNINDANKARFTKGSLCDYMGLPVQDQTATLEGTVKVSTLPFRAYTQIFNDYYRDQNMRDEVDFSKAGGYQGDFGNISVLRQRAWGRDYFTSALPWAQRGPEVNLPVEINYRKPAQLFNPDGDPAAFGNAVRTVNNDGTNFQTDTALESLTVENIDDLGLTINDIRRSARLQEWLERNARGGARYVEQLLSHWGVISDDARLQRAEYLGGGKNPISISEVLQTSGTETAGDNVETPLGQMAGHGIAASQRHGFRRKFKEHGYVIGIMSVLPVTAYEQGVPRHFSRFDKLDYPWPEFANLGEQEIINKEIFADLANNADPANLEKTFGYTPRYSEEKFGISTVHGDMRDNLSYWHMGRKFDALPVLNDDFIKADPTKRIFAVEDQEEDELYCQIYNNISAVRRLPYYGTPTL